MYQVATKIPNRHKTDQTAIKYTNIFHCKTLQNLPKFGFSVWKYTICATLSRNCFRACQFT
jgi:hypothetical protein